MATFEITMVDSTRELVVDAEGYAPEGPMTTFFTSDGGRGCLDSWATRIASVRIGQTDGQGRHRWEFPSAALVPTYNQAVFVDWEAMGGWAQSNAVQRVGPPAPISDLPSGVVRPTGQ